MTGLAARILAEDGPRVSFVYLGAVDAVGHVLGAGAPYREAARIADERVGRLLSAVRSRPSVADEGWTIVVVTDHGHLDQGGHGGREPRSRRPGQRAPGRASP
jgi:predicted AlkP superfamily pyrophosphatase or phosphodiesterase